MSLARFPDQNLLSEPLVLRMIERKLAAKKPFSLVRIGDGENIVLSQYNLLSEMEFMETYWAKQSQIKMKKGVTLPNIRLRDQMIRGIRHASIVGICRTVNDEVLAPEKFKRPMTNQLFDLYNLSPNHLTNVFINRKIVSHRLFWEILHHYRVLLISRWAQKFKDLILKKYSALRPRIVGCIDFKDYSEIPAVMRKIGSRQFDLALVSTGVNAVVLAPMIAETFGKVAIDFGKTMMFFLNGDKRIKPWFPPKAWSSTLKPSSPRAKFSSNMPKGHVTWDTRVKARDPSHYP
jgi:hypothetical protein